MEQAGSFIAVGRRKNAIARVRLMPGKGNITVNERPWEKFFIQETHRLMIKQPLLTTNMQSKFDCFANISGGGASGQAGAMRLGIARALLLVDPALRPVLKKSDFLTRDPRMKERKKYGQKGARKRFQWTKR